jgi:adenylosuccinate synthase
MLINGFTEIILTKIDILDSLEEIKVCIAYKINGVQIDSFPVTVSELNKVEPVYIRFNGWLNDITNIKNYHELPQNCKNYIKAIEDMLSCKVKIVSVGPSSEQTIFRSCVQE